MQDTGVEIEIWGVCGGSASGKTTLVEQIEQRLGADQVLTIPHDSYYRDLSHLSFDERCEVNYDHPDSLETDLLVAHLAELRLGRAVAIPVYDFAEHNRAPDLVVVEPRPLIIVDGILLFSVDDLRDTFDRRIYIDVPTEERLARRVRRDVEERGRHPDEVRHNFESVVLPMHRQFVSPHRSAADWIIEHPDDRDAWLDRVVTETRSRLVE
ncbi:MAG: uridine kinase [Acidimicrobiales bacterium]